MHRGIKETRLVHQVASRFLTLRYLFSRHDRDDWVVQIVIKKGLRIRLTAKFIKIIQQPTIVVDEMSGEDLLF